NSVLSRALIRLRKAGLAQHDENCGTKSSNPLPSSGESANFRFLEGSREVPRMRYPAAEKLEIIRLVEQSPLPVRNTPVQLGIPRATFYRWYDRYSRGGPEVLNDRPPRPDRVWNRIPDAGARQRHPARKQRSDG